MENIRISLRLKEISKHIPKASFFADIGSDHAYLPSYVCLNDEKAIAIDGEVNKGPYNKAKEVVNSFQLNNRIDVRLGDGLSILETDEPDTLVIAGMGGKLIEHLLDKDLNKTLKINKLILQPNVDADLLRKWLIKYNNAKEVVNSFQLNNRIDVRLGDGLSILETDEPDTLVIAGMGGKLIEHLLDKDLNKTLKINKLILQPNVDADLLRKWLIKYNYNLVSEKVIEENTHFYEILVAEKSNKLTVYSESIDFEKQIYFGPLLIKERSVEFIKKWEEEKKKLSRIIKEMKQAKLINHKKVNQFTKKLNWIEEVLSNESCNK